MNENKSISTRLTKIENILEEIKQNILEPLDHDRPITVNEAAEMLCCSTQSIRDAIHHGELKAQRRGRRYLLSYHEVRNRTTFNIYEKKIT